MKWWVESLTRLEVLCSRVWISELRFMLWLRSLMVWWLMPSATASWVWLLELWFIINIKFLWVPLILLLDRWTFSWARTFVALSTCCGDHKVILLSRRRKLVSILSAWWMGEIDSLPITFILLLTFSLTHYFKILLGWAQRRSWWTSDILFVALARWNRLCSRSQNRCYMLFHLNCIFLIDIVVLLLWRVAFVKELKFSWVLLCDRQAAVISSLCRRWPEICLVSAPQNLSSTAADSHETERAAIVLISRNCVSPDKNSPPVSLLFDLRGLVKFREFCPWALLTVEVSVAHDELFVFDRLTLLWYLRPSLGLGSKSSLKKLIFVHLQLLKKSRPHLEVLAPWVKELQGLEHAPSIPSHYECCHDKASPILCFFALD